MNCRAFICLLTLICISFPSASCLHAQGVVWTGPMFSFTNTAGSSPALAENQDHLTDDVWFTRGAKKGIFNIAPGQETAYQFDSPRGTEWAVGVLADYASLSYTNWAACFGGQGNLLSSITTTSAVVHLVNSDIYLALTFTSWGGSAGGFSYQRSTPLLAVPEPGSEKLAWFAVVATGLFCRWRKNNSCSAS